MDQARSVTSSRSSSTRDDSCIHATYVVESADEIKVAGQTACDCKYACKALQIEATKSNEFEYDAV